MTVKNITDEQLQNFILNKIEQAYTLQYGLHEKQDLLGQPYYIYDYQELSKHVANNDLPKGYYVLCAMFNQEESRGVVRD